MEVIQKWAKWRLMESKNRSPLVTDQMESSLALHFLDFADMAPKNGDFGEQSPLIRTSLRAKILWRSLSKISHKFLTWHDMSSKDQVRVFGRNMGVPGCFSKSKFLCCVAIASHFDFHNRFGKYGLSPTA